MKAHNISRRSFLAVTGSLVLGGLAGCGGNQSNAADEVHYADDEAMATIAKGWEKRQDIVDAIDDDTKNNDSKYGEALQKGIQAEIDADASLKDAKFQDSKLQEKVLAYINILDDQYELAGEFDSANFDFYEKWNEIYDERSMMLKDFADNYGMTVADKYADNFKELMVNGKSAQEKSDKQDAINALIAGASWEKSDDGYGSFTYTAIVENTSDYDFSNVSLTVNLYDADDVKTEAYANVTTWRKGEKAKFEAYGYQVDAQRVEGVVTYFDVDD